MTWFFLALGTAVIQALKDALMKRSGLFGPSVVLVYSLVMAGLLAPLALWRGIPPLPAVYWLTLPATAALAAFSFTAYFRALSASSDLSATTPMLAFTPLFMLLTSPLIVGEFPGRQGLVGMLCVVAGSYLLHFSHRRHGLLAPFKALAAEPGPRWMLLVAALWSVTGNLDKVGIQAVGVSFWLFSVMSLVCVFLLPFCLLRDRKNLARACRRPDTALLGGMEVVSLLLQMTALQMTLVPYVISVKRMSVLFGVVLGAWLFKERGFSERFVGAGVMLAGVVLIITG